MARGRPKVRLVLYACAGCGAEQLRYPSTSKKNTTGRVFCSVACRNRIGCKPRRGSERQCVVCSHSFYAGLNSPQRFCSVACHNKWQGRNSVQRRCEMCGKEFLLAPAVAAKTPGKYCSRRCDGMSKRRRVQNAFHNGMPKLLDPHGYVKVWEPDLPVHRRWVLEHRLVMEKAIGRKLQATEHVHHLDGNKQNNSIENLQIINPSEHARVTAGMTAERQRLLIEELETFRRRYGPLTESG